MSIEYLMESKNPPKYCQGHRKRLRQKFRQSKGRSLSDYEVLELFLFSLIPYKDTKTIAKELIQTFGTFDNIAAAEEQRLCQISGIGPLTAFALKVYGEMVIRQTKQRILDTPLINSWQAVIDYIRVSDGYKTSEEVHVLFLNKKNHLIADEVLFCGTIDQTPFYIRDILKRALDLNAVAIILVHNHPSGDPTPSAEDIEQTRELNKAAQTLGIILHDHFIIAKNSYTSLRTLGVFDESMI